MRQTNGRESAIGRSGRGGKWRLGRKNLHQLVFRAIYREKPEKGLRARDWKESSDAEVEAEVDRRFGTRQSRKRKSLQQELLKWAALVAKTQVRGSEAGKRERERGLDSDGIGNRWRRGIRRMWNSGLAIGIIV